MTNTKMNIEGHPAKVTFTLTPEQAKALYWAVQPGSVFDNVDTGLAIAYEQIATEFEAHLGATLEDMGCSPEDDPDPTDNEPEGHRVVAINVNVDGIFNPRIVSDAINEALDRRDRLRIA